MTRPITLFTGQWADLPFEEVCRLAASWGYDGLEIACWGDHFEVDRALAEDDYVAGRREILERHGLGVWAISNHLVGQAVCDDPIDQRHRDILPASVWGDGDPEGVRQRAAERMADTARAAAKLGVDVVIGFTGSAIWKYVAMFPPVSAETIEAGYQDFADRWNPILDVYDEVGVRFAHEVHPSEIAYDHWTTVRTLEAIGHRPGLRAELGPEPHGLAGPRPGRLHLGLPGPDLPRRLQGRPQARGQRPQRPALVAPAVGRPAPRLGLRLHRPRRRAVGGLLPHAGRDRLRRPVLGGVGGRRHGPPGRRRRGRRVRPPARLRPPRRRLRRRLQLRGTDTGCGGWRPATAVADDRRRASDQVAVAVACGSRCARSAGAPGSTAGSSAARG